MKTLNYFPHEFNARNDSKLVELRMDMGNRGIGVYWSIVEMLYEEGGRMELSKLKSVAFAINEELTIVQQVIQQYDLFEYDERFFWSNAIFSRLKHIKKISDARVKAGKASGKARKEKALQVIKNEEDTNQTFVQQKLNKYSTDIEQNDEQNRTIKNKIKIKIKENKNNNTKDANTSLSSTEDEEAINYEEIINYYNSTCKRCNLISCIKLTPRRQEAIRARVKAYGKEKIMEAIKKAAESPFLNGSNDRNWRADIDFIFDNNKMARILEGKYDNNEKNSYGQRNLTGAERQYKAGETAYNRVLSRIGARQDGKTEIDTNDLFRQSTDGDMQGQG